MDDTLTYQGVMITKLFGRQNYNIDQYDKKLRVQDELQQIVVCDFPHLEYRQLKSF